MLLPLFLAALAVLSCSFVAADVYSDMNDAFKSQYVAIVYEELDMNDGPLFLSSGNLTFLYGSRNESVSVTPRTFTLLKDASHAVLTTYLILEFNRDMPLPAEVMKNLSSHASRVSACIEDLMKGNQNDYLTNEQKTNVISVLKEVVSFGDQVLKDKMVHSNVLVGFCSSQTAAIESFMEGAVQAKTVAIINAVKKWKATLTDEEWRKSKAIVQTSKFPRTNQMELQVFLAIFNNPREGYNVYQLTELNGPLPLSVQKFYVGRFMADLTSGEAFFSNPWSLTSDILGNATMAVIKDLKQSGQLPFAPSFKLHQLWAASGLKCPFK
eukprot:m.307199 g.307199  ORF g.307199 m.307199 type:complete len:325 (+) comp42009_c0_seq1:400-1374(+)